MLYPISGLDICNLNTKKKKKMHLTNNFGCKSIVYMLGIGCFLHQSNQQIRVVHGNIYISIGRIWFIKVSLNSRLSNNHNSMHEKHYQKISTRMLLATILLHTP